MWGGDAATPRYGREKVHNRRLISLALFMLVLATFGLGGCGQGPKGDPGQPGLQGPQGPSLRVVRNNCLSGECTASCRGDEVLVSAYCGPSHNAATFLDERQASCGIEVTSANAPLVAVCVQAPQ